MDARFHGGRAGARARERDRLLLRPQPRRHAARESLCRPDLRPYRAQGRPHRDRDHQPADGAGVGAPGAAPRGAPRDGACSLKERRACRRPDDRHSRRRVPLRLGKGGAAGDRRRADHVPLPHALGRQEHGRACHGLARGSAVARHGDGAVSSHRAPCRTRYPHDRHCARGRPARGRRASARRRDAPLHGRLRREARARHTRRGQSRHVCRDEGAPHHAPWRTIYKDGSPRAGAGGEGVQRHGGALPRLRFRSRRRARRSGTDRALSWAA